MPALIPCLSLNHLRVLLFCPFCFWKLNLFLFPYFTNSISPGLQVLSNQGSELHVQPHPECDSGIHISKG